MAFIAGAGPVATEIPLAPDHKAILITGQQTTGYTSLYALLRIRYKG